MKKSNVWTIVRKEFARFFGDRTLVFTTILMPGLLIYFIYSFMGDNLNDLANGSEQTPVVYVDNLPQSLQPMFDSLPYEVVTSDFNAVALVGDSLHNKDCSLIYVSFPAQFDSLVATYDPQSGLAAPNVRIYHNSVSTASDNAYTLVSGLLDSWEMSLCNRFDINALSEENPETFDMASEEDVVGDILAQLFPMLLLMLLFSGCMAVAPPSIAGEKERGTIATLLVTPLRRSELAIGKILSLSTIAMLSGLSSFLGIILSLPKLIQADDLGISIHYSSSDYVMLLLILLSTVLVMISLISIISAYAKSVKAASTMVMPLMILILFIGMSPMLGSGVAESLGLYLIPFYNSVQSMAAVFSNELTAGAATLTVVSNLIYTTLAVFALTRMFNSEKVMFGK